MDPAFDTPPSAVFQSTPVVPPSVKAQLRPEINSSFFSVRSGVQSADGFLRNLSNGDISELNGSARVIWKHISVGAPFLEILARLEEEFPQISREVLENDLRALVDDLESRRLIHRRSLKPPRVSLIVPAMNSAKLLPACLNSIMALEFPSDDLEIIIVDNNSTDATPFIIDRYPVIHEFAETRNRAIARNAGCRIARGEIFAFVDSDSTVSPTWLTEIVREFETPTIGYCQGAIVGSSVEERIIPVRPTDRFGLLPVVGGAGIAMRASVVRAVGFFDEGLPRTEDADLAWRVIHAGYDVAFVNSAVVATAGVANFSSAIRRHLENLHADIQFCPNWLPATDLLWTANWIPALLGGVWWSVKKFVESPSTERAFGLGVSIFRVIWMPSLMLLGRFRRDDRARVTPRVALLAKNGNTSYHLEPDVRILFDDEGASILGLEKRRHFRTNRIGALFLQMMLERGASVERITRDVATLFSVSTLEARTDLLEFLGDLERADLLETRDDAARFEREDMPSELREVSA